MDTHIKFDWAFKRLLRQKANFSVLEGFLSVLLSEQITIIELIESESNQDKMDSKFNRVDILIKNSKDEHIIVEIQNERENDFFQRMHFGQAKVITERLLIGERSEEIKRVISVAIVYFNLGEGDDYVYKGTTNFVGLHSKEMLKLDRSQRKIYPGLEVQDLFTTYYILKVNNFNQQAKSSLDEWIYFLKNSTIPNSFTAQGLDEANKKLRIDSMSRAEQENYYNYMKILAIRDSELDSAILEGHEIGFDDGFDDGFKDGFKEGKVAVAKSLRESGVSIEVIELSTGLTAEEIKSGLKE